MKTYHFLYFIFSLTIFILFSSGLDFSIGANLRGRSMNGFLDGLKKMDGSVHVWWMDGTDLDGSVHKNGPRNELFV